MEKNNRHIEAFIDYYAKLEGAPQYAVLLNGKWGTGKTWLINRVIENLERAGIKCIYVSLYGMEKIEDIENEFFRILHPVLSKKSMAIAGKIFKGLLKSTLKIDLNNDNAGATSLSTSLPDVELPSYFKDVSGSLLIFDDLERCPIDIVKLLGYINYFVEHKDHKVILVANEEEILSQDGCREASEHNQNIVQSQGNAYTRFKEKVIGKTFTIIAQESEALSSFIKSIKSDKIREFANQNRDQILQIYSASKFENLRHLRLALMEFDRLSEQLPADALDNKDFVGQLLSIFLIFDFEIRNGSFRPKDIQSVISDSYLSGREGVNPKKNLYEYLTSKYEHFDIFNMIFDPGLWAELLDKGIADAGMLGSAVYKTTYFKKDSDPDWVKLWHFFDLRDEQFASCLATVEKDFHERKFREIGIIKHIVGLKLRLAAEGLYNKSDEEILFEAKRYADDLKNEGPAFYKMVEPRDFESRCEDSWGGMGFYCHENQRFREFVDYIEAKADEAKIEHYPADAEDLLRNMSANTDKFVQSLGHAGKGEGRYLEVPILKYIDAVSFVDSLLGLAPAQIRAVSKILASRYGHAFYRDALLPEREWLESVLRSLNLKIDKAAKPVLAFQLGKYFIPSIQKAIQVLDRAKAKSDQTDQTKAEDA